MRADVYRAADETWFVLIVTWTNLSGREAIGFPIFTRTPGFPIRPELMANMPQLAGILDEVFAKEPMRTGAKCSAAFTSPSVRCGVPGGHRGSAASVERDHRSPRRCGGQLTSTVSSPIQVHGVAKAPANRAPAIGEHNAQVLAATRLHSGGD